MWTFSPHTVSVVSPSGVTVLFSGHSGRFHQHCVSWPAPSRRGALDPCLGVPRSLAAGHYEGHGHRCYHCHDGNDDCNDTDAATGIRTGGTGGASLPRIALGASGTHSAGVAIIAIRAGVALGAYGATGSGFTGRAGQRKTSWLSSRQLGTVAGAGMSGRPRTCGTRNGPGNAPNAKAPIGTDPISSDESPRVRVTRGYSK